MQSCVQQADPTRERLLRAGPLRNYGTFVGELDDGDHPGVPDGSAVFTCLTCLDAYPRAADAARMAAREAQWPERSAAP